MYDKYPENDIPRETGKKKDRIAYPDAGIYIFQNPALDFHALRVKREKQS